MAIEMKFKNRIQDLRKARKMTQTQLAKYLGVAQPTLSGWEIGIRQADNESIRTMSELFNVSIDYLLCETDTLTPRDPSTEVIIKEEVPKEIIRLAERIQELTPEAKDLIVRQIRLFEAMDKK